MNNLMTKKLYKLSFMLISSGLACFALFLMIGAVIDEQGILHEPFALIPIGWVFIGLGCALGVAALFFQWVRSRLG